MPRRRPPAAGKCARSCRARFAVELDVAAGLLDEAVDHAEAEAGAGAGRFGGEERLEGAPAHLVRHACSGVGDRDQHVAAGAHLRVHLRIVGVEPRRARSRPSAVPPRGMASRALIARLSSAFCNCAASTTAMCGDPATPRSAVRPLRRGCGAADLRNSATSGPTSVGLRIERLPAAEGEQLRGQLRAVLARRLAPRLTQARAGADLSRMASSISRLPMTTVRGC